jgi:hypothetical protein
VLIKFPSETANFINTDEIAAVEITQTRLVVVMSAAANGKVHTATGDPRELVAATATSILDYTGNTMIGVSGNGNGLNLFRRDSVVGVFVRNLGGGHRDICVALNAAANGRVIPVATWDNTATDDTVNNAVAALVNAINNGETHHKIG